MNKNKKKRAYKFSNINLDNVAKLIFNRDFRGIEKNSVFTKDKDRNLFVYEKNEPNKFTTITLSNTAVDKLIKENPTLLSIWFESIKLLDDVYNLNDLKVVDDIVDNFKSAIKYDSDNCDCNKYREDLDIWKAEYISAINKLNKSEEEISRLNDLLKTKDWSTVILQSKINNLLTRYKNEFEEIEILDELEFDKIEQKTVLQNLITLLEYLRKG